jgi:hypothetical protein
MSAYRSNWAAILGLLVGFLSLTAQAQHVTILNASLPGEPTASAPEPISPPAPALTASSYIRLAPPVAVEARVADRHFWTLVAFTGGSAVLDGESTMRGLQHPGTREMNPLLGSHPNRARFYASAGASDAAIAYLAYRFKRAGHEKLWKAPLLGAGTVHLGASINNLRY